MREVTCHEVDARRLDEASEDIVGRAAGRWHGMRYDDPAPRRMAEAAAELLDHVAARTGRGAVLDEVARAALRTAAECRLGELSVGCFPDGDQEIPFPLIGEQLSTEDMSFGAAIGHPGAAAPSARTWLDAFAVCLVSGLVLDWQRVIGLLLRNDYAPAIHEGVPYSPLTSASDPADLATMDALCLYLREAEGHLPRHWPTVPLRRPDADERQRAAAALDAAGAPTPDQRLLRILLDDEQHAFETALADRLDSYRESQGPDTAPRTLLPLDALALAALAVQAHGWELGVRSRYLPTELLGTTDALRRAA
ncbi:Imm49 family immunity protein [Streptomyces sp. ATCC51928]|uniref:Imm49 family immunity protein n=1 Tax=Streptomyces caviscabies TaxID=90079 RepID=A0ABW2MFZ5_9ACTN|nr:MULTISPECIES: Imm49 family immunity protein [unclassified Streptomyces]MDX3501774.1 Imm49 family immunity protein [Streptomyces sp. ATCC51928]MDX5523106.1 Imm49 family immunity protein [Streptomyces sp. DE06-01C]